MKLLSPTRSNRYYCRRRFRVQTRHAQVGIRPPRFRLVKFYERRNPAIAGGWELIHTAAQESTRPLL